MRARTARGANTARRPVRSSGRSVRRARPHLSGRLVAPGPGAAGNSPRSSPLPSGTFRDGGPVSAPCVPDREQEKMNCGLELRSELTRPQHIPAQPLQAKQTELACLDHRSVLPGNG